MARGSSFPCGIKPDILAELADLVHLKKANLYYYYYSFL